MKIRFFTDAHHAHERTASRPHRYSEMALALTRECAATTPPDFDALVFGGDAIQQNKRATRPYHEDLLREFGAAVRQNTAVPVYAIAGNHEFDYFNDLGAVSALTGIAMHPPYLDTPDGQRLIFLNDKFHCQCERVLLPFSEENLGFLEQALRSAPGKAVTLFTHTPLDDFDEHLGKIVTRDYDAEFSFRTNTAAMRDIIEQSGKNVLVLSGHTHYENFSRHGNAAYLTVQSLVEGVRGAAQETVFERWVDIERPNDTDIRIRLHGYKGYEINHRFAREQASPDPASAPAFPPPLLAAE